MHFLSEGMRGFFEIRHLAPNGVLAQVPAVIPPETDNGIFPHSQPVQLTDQAPDLGIDIDTRFLMAGKGTIGRPVRHGLVIGQRDTFRWIEVEVLLRSHKRQMRADEAHGQEKRPVFVFVLVQKLDSLIRSFSIAQLVIGAVGPLPDGAVDRYTARAQEDRTGFGIGQQRIVFRTWPLASAASVSSSSWARISFPRYVEALGAQWGSLHDWGSSSPPWNILLSPCV